MDKYTITNQKNQKNHKNQKKTKKNTKTNEKPKKNTKKQKTQKQNQIKTKKKQKINKNHQKKSNKNQKNKQKKIKNQKSKLKNKKQKNKIKKNTKNTKKTIKINKYTKKQIKISKKQKNKIKHSENGNINKNLVLMNWNKGNSKFLHRIDTIRHIIQEHRPDIFAIQEANLSNSDDIRLAQVQGYYLETDQLIQYKNLARTVMYISHDIKYKRLKELESKIEPVIWVEIIKTGGTKKLKIQNYYRQWQEINQDGAIPNTKSVKSQKSRFSQIIKTWANQISNNESEIISMSDTNIDLQINYSTPSQLDIHERKMVPLFRLLNTQIFNIGASVVKTDPTKIHHNKDYTNIDHLITNFPLKIIQPQVIKSGYSDHLITKFIRLNKNPIHQQKYRIMRNFRIVNWSQAKAEILIDTRLQTALTSTHPQTIAENLIGVIEDNISTQAPLKRIQVSNKIPSFISSETREILRQRDIALKNSKQTNANEDDIRLYKTLRNRSHKLISTDRKKFISKKFTDAERDPKKLWEITKNTIGWTKNSSPNTISFQGKTYHKPKEIANIINHQQILRNIRLHRNVPKTQTDPMTNFKKLTENKKLKFELKQISIRQLMDQIRDMKATPSTGVDNISLKTIKQLLPVIKYQILNLVNSTIKTGIYPKNLKCAKVIPILKNKKPPNDPLSYRCVNILPSLAKIIDRTVNNQITEHMIKNELFLHQHNGGIRGRGTTTAVLSMLDEWAYSLEQGEDSAVLILDQSAAFDVVWHPLLLKKLQELGFQPNTMRFFENYLNQRSQKVIVDSFCSDELEIGPLSVCQGSTLSGLLYLIFTLDYPLIHQEKVLQIPQYVLDKKPKTNTFVDDSISRIILSKDTTQNNTTIKNFLDDIGDYMNANCLVLNQDKSKIIVITQDNNIRDAIKVDIEGMEEPMKPTRTMTYLGIDIKDDLRWNYFIEDSPYQPN